MMGRFALAFVVVAGCAVDPPGGPSDPQQGHAGGTSNAPGTAPTDSFRTAPAAEQICSSPPGGDISACPVTTIELSPVTVMTWVALISSTQLTLDHIAVTSGPEGACITAITIYTQVAGQPIEIGTDPGTLCDGEIASPLVLDLPAGTDYTISVGGQFVTP